MSNKNINKNGTAEEGVMTSIQGRGGEKSAGERRSCGKRRGGGGSSHTGSPLTRP